MVVIVAVVVVAVVVVVVIAVVRDDVDAANDVCGVVDGRVGATLLLLLSLSWS